MFSEQPFAAPSVPPPAPLLRGNSMVRPGLSRQNSGLRSSQSPLITSSKSMSMHLNKEKEEGRVDVGGLNPGPFKLETVAACQMITFIYEAKVRWETHIFY